MRLEQTLEKLLERFGAATDDPIAPWVALIDALRPPRASQAAKATDRLRALTHILARRDDLRAGLAAALRQLFTERKQVSLYVSSGLLPSTGFFSETARRVSGRLLPEVIDTGYLKDLLSVLFHRSDDEIWVNAVADELWIDFLHTVLAAHGNGGSGEGELPVALSELLEALRMLSYHVSAIGLDPELVRIDPQLEEFESPFLAQNTEIVRYLEQFKTWWLAPDAALEDERHLTVLLGQCDEVLQRVRRRATKLGTSLTLTFKLERLRQHLERIAALLELLGTLREQRSASAIAPQAVTLFKQLVRAECRKNRLSDYWGQNVELLSLRMIESASKTGEHYITASRGEYFDMLRSAALGGLIIAFMSAFKLILGRQGMAPLNEALAFCLNYGLGFVLIHMLGGTVATKQPAMTANAIAASIGEARGKTRNLENLADLIVRTVRSQIAAILGNIGIAIPLAIALSLALHATTGAHLVDPSKAHHLLADVDPRSGALFFAAVAGVCLFLSGLISGYYDNLSAYNRIPQRLLQLRWPRRLLGERRMQRVASYVENNLGALAGNFFFGFLLGGATAVGVLFGLPLDIRHIAFSSANLGYAVAGLDFAVPLQALLLAFSGVALIGVVNLGVSFTLTLYVAMRARSITFAQGRSLAALLARRLLTRPQDYLLPPLRTAPQNAGTATEPVAPATTAPAAQTPLGPKPPNG